ncbi:hypothetical protein PybrP1_004623 [[Pythium] brassicae (nom. inval.)]|nr:hypothetical protein PybrP1_004623 [[Pythium] brassicae (nom. inval.)]
MNSAEVAEDGAPVAPTPALYVVLSNQSSKQNLGTYLRTATAFGATQVVVVGTTRFGTHGAHRAHKFVDIAHFYKFDDARAYLKSKGCAILGLCAPTAAATALSSTAAHETAFTCSTAFVVDNEAPGLSPAQRAVCDGFVHVPCHGAQATPAGLDTTVVLAIALHHFTAWAQFTPRATEATRTQGKFVLDALPAPTRDAHKATERARKRAPADEADLADALGRIFD